MKISKIALLLTALIVIVLIAQNILLNVKIKESRDISIAQTTQEANLTVTKIFINELYPQIAPILQLKEQPNQTKGLEGDELNIVDKEIRAFMLGTDILKIKIYSLNGMTIYSSEASQINQDKSSSQAIIDSTQGKVASQITHRGKFSALEGEVFDKDLVSSYLPIRDQLGAVIGVAEIYTDRTKAIEKSNQDLSEINAYMLLSQVLLAILVFFIFWNNIINTKKE